MLAISNSISPTLHHPSSQSDENLLKALTLLNSILKQLNSTDVDTDNIRIATLQLLSLPEPKYIDRHILKASLSNDDTHDNQTTSNNNIFNAIDKTLEFYKVSSKKNVKNLQKLVLLKEWEKGRLQRWWVWHDEQLQILQQEDKKKLRRREFLSTLRTHPWVNNSEKTIVSSPLMGEELKRETRRKLLAKLEKDGSLSSPAQIPIEEIQLHSLKKQEKRKSALSRLKLPRSSPITQITPPPPPKTASSEKAPHTTLPGISYEEIKPLVLTGVSVVGQLSVSTKSDYWSKWDAQESLLVSRKNLFECVAKRIADVEKMKEGDQCFLLSRKDLSLHAKLIHKIRFLELGEETH